ncbi:uncharacterized protein Dyak_GE27450, isoform B [Drosophila yakuba]|uniref:Uncharacterized protein, isoform B n=1 Tax=Drosophila yakuba TaxID=7245 RepID=A0A0R1DM11_DROYA|nr:uncharacterized protein Dyak_GE27450, isoform B [Drosophila yakuba]
MPEMSVRAPGTDVDRAGDRLLAGTVGLRVYSSEPLLNISFKLSQLPERTEAHRHHRSGNRCHRTTAH